MTDDDVILDPAATSVRVAPGTAEDALRQLRASARTEEGLVVAAGVGPDGLTPGASEVLHAVGVDPVEVVVAYEPSGGAGDVTRLPLAASEHGVRLVLLVGVADSAPTALRRAGAAVARACRDRAGLVSVVPTGEHTAAYVEGLVLGGYTPPRWTDGGVRPSATPVPDALLVGDVDDATVAGAAVRARATLTARNLANVPSNIKNPAWMAEQARLLAERSGLSVEVWTEDVLSQEGFGGLLAVGGGSATPPRLVQLGWTPPGATTDTPHVVLVGKGITFDTGGVNVKPAASMAAMKTDMAGSAVVLAVIAACPELQVPVRVTALMPLAENAVGGGSYRPGDVVTQYGGRTVEIGNTDAEGRIVMADALAYADLHLEPDVLVDVATLTGAARVALARTMAPLFSTDPVLAEEISASGETTGEPFWILPLVEDYRAALDSDVADVNHVAPKVGGGSITAALFLREFAGTRRWAHLDVAGTGRSDADTGILAKGATGYGARALLSWLERAR